MVPGAQPGPIYGKICKNCNKKYKNKRITVVTNAVFVFARLGCSANKVGQYVKSVFFCSAWSYPQAHQVKLESLFVLHY